MQRSNPFNTTLEWTTFAIALLGFVSLNVTGQIGWGTLGFGYGLMALSRVRHRLPWLPNQRQWRHISIFMLGLCLGQWQIFTRDLLPPILLFTTYLQVVKLFDLRTSRDIFQVLTIAFGMVLLASVLTTSPLFLLTAIAFGLAALLELVLLTFRGEADRLDLSRATPAENTVQSQVESALGRLVGRRFALGMATTAITLFVLSTVLFLMLPRYQGNDWLRSFRRAVQNVEGDTASGGGENTVELGDISRIRLDPTIVMRVSLPDVTAVADVPPRDHVRMRGVAHRDFDGQRWTLEQMVTDDFIAFSGIDNMASDAPDNLHQVIFQEAGSTPYLHWITRLARFRLGGSRARDLEVSTIGSWARLANVSQLDEPITYEAWSDDMQSDFHPATTRRIPNFSPVVISEGDDPEDVIARMENLYRRSGNGWDLLFSWYMRSTEWTEANEPIRQLAIQWAAEGNCTDPISIANEFTRRLRSPPFEYSLNPGTSGAEYPVTEFLTERRVGHCEYFASALALMLRGVGIPSRLVTGYHSDEWNSSGQFFVVREAHAHAWVEVYIPDGRGWLPWDPTPPAGLVAQVSGSRWLWLTHWFDARRHAWYRWVIDLGQSQQREILRAIGLPRLGGGFGMRGVIWRLRRMIRSGGVSALGAITAIAGSMMLVALLLWTIWARHRERKLRRSRLHRAAVFYRQLVQWLEKRGHRRPVGITPGEFADQVVSVHPEWSAVSVVTDFYYRERYSPIPLDITERERAEALVRSLTGR